MGGGNEGWGERGKEGERYLKLKNVRRLWSRSAVKTKNSF